jgi:hypothetical protein
MSLRIWWARTVSGVETRVSGQESGLTCRVLVWWVVVGREWEWMVVVLDFGGKVGV